MRLYYLSICLAALICNLNAQPYAYYSAEGSLEGSYVVIGSLGSVTGLFLVQVKDGNVSNLLDSNYVINFSLDFSESNQVDPGEFLTSNGELFRLDVLSQMLDFEKDFKVSNNDLIRPFLSSYARQLRTAVEIGDSERSIALIERLEKIKSMDGEYRFKENSEGDHRLHVLNGNGDGLIYDWSTYNSSDRFLAQRGLNLGGANFSELGVMFSSLSKFVSVLKDSANHSIFEMMKGASLGAGVAPNEAGWGVMYVQPSSVADILGIKIGDTISAVDSVRTPDLSEAEFKNLVKDFKEITVIRNDSSHTFSTE